MASYTSGSSSFNLDFNEIAEEAYERCGIEMRTGYQLRTARRSLNIITMDWANKGLNLWTIEQGEIPLVAGQVTYPLPANTVDLVDHVIRQNQASVNQTDISITRISGTNYLNIPNKLTQGRPIQIYINRQSGMANPTSALLVGNGTTTNISATDTTIQISSTVGLPSTGYIQIDSEIIFYASVLNNQLQLCARGQNNTTAAAHTAGAVIYQQNLPMCSVYPTPNNGGNYTLVYWRMRRIQDAGVGGQVEDIPFRLLPCLIAALAYQLAVKSPEAMDRIDRLKVMADEAWLLATQEDREKAAARFVPRQQFF
jgi:hypothetical protein